MSNDKLNPQLFKQAQSMQRNLLKLREEMKERVVEGAAGGGLVTAFANGNGELVKITLKKEAVDPSDVAMLEDLIVAAVQKAQEEAQAMQQAEMSKVTGGMSLPGLLSDDVASYGESVDRLLEELAKLPGVGRKTAERLAHHILRASNDEAMALAVAIRDVKKNTRSCSRCANVTESDPCAICTDASRDAASVCVVEQPRDLVAIEEAGAWRGVYHVLGGRVSPLDGVSAEDLTIDRLVARVKEGGVREVVLATSPDMEGDGTALYVERALAPTGVKITRLARGVPSGYALENSSAAMLQDAFRGRQGSISEAGRSDEEPPARR